MSGMSGLHPAPSDLSLAGRMPKVAWYRQTGSDKYRTQLFLAKKMGRTNQHCPLDTGTTSDSPYFHASLTEEEAHLYSDPHSCDLFPK